MGREQEVEGKSIIACLGGSVLSGPTNGKSYGFRGSLSREKPSEWMVQLCQLGPW